MLLSRVLRDKSDFIESSRGNTDLIVHRAPRLHGYLFSARKDMKMNAFHAAETRILGLLETKPLLFQAALYLPRFDQNGAVDLACIAILTPAAFSERAVSRDRDSAGVVEDNHLAARAKLGDVRNSLGFGIRIELVLKADIVACGNLLERFGLLMHAAGDKNNLCRRRKHLHERDEILDVL